MRAASIGGLVALMAMSMAAFGQDDQERAREGETPERDGQRERGDRDGDRPAPRDGDRPGPRGFASRMPLMVVLDANRDGELSAEEVSQAVAALKKLDKNEDGVIDREELRPQPPFGEGRGPRPRGDADRPRPEGERPQRERESDRPDREDAERGPRGGRERGPRPEGDRGPGGRGPGEFGGPRMDPERFVNRLMESDADGDGKLSREELLKAVENMGRGRGPGPGPGPGRGDHEDNSDRPQRPE